MSLASVFLLPPRKGAGLSAPRTDEHPRPMPPYPQLSPRACWPYLRLGSFYRLRELGEGASPTSSILGDGESEQTSLSHTPQGGSLQPALLLLEESRE